MGFSIDSNTRTRAITVRTPLRSRYLLLYLIFPLITSSVYSDVIPGRWEKVEAESKGTELVIVLKSGERQISRYAGSDQGVLRLYDETGSEYSIQKVDISKVVREKSNPGTKGLLIGAGIGAVSGFLATRSYAGEAKAGPLIVTSTGICALIGYLVDRSPKKTEILYRSQDLP